VVERGADDLRCGSYTDDLHPAVSGSMTRVLGVMMAITPTALIIFAVASLVLEGYLYLVWISLLSIRVMSLRFHGDCFLVMLSIADFDCPSLVFVGSD